MEIGRKRISRTAIVVAASLACATLLALSLDIGNLAAANTANDPTQLTNQIFTHLAEGNNAAASKLIKQHLEQYPNDQIMLYNAACTACQLGEPEEGSKFLIKAVKAGFNDFAHMRRDSDLKPLRDHPIYKAILAARDAADNLLAQRSIDWWHKTFGEDTYRQDKDAKLRLNFLSNLDDDAFEQMRSMLEAEADYLSGTLFDNAVCQYVLVAYPKPEHVNQLLPRQITAGIYRHRRRELITTDTDSSLRHEFAHRMHHAHMDFLGQEHPLWIQEGIATLFEDYEINADGSIYFVPNERDKYAMKLEQAGRLLSLSEVIDFSRKDLTNQAIIAYPQLRSIFRFLAEHKLLNKWYDKYITDFDDDPTGKEALQFVFDNPLDQIQAIWKKWLHRQSIGELQTTYKNSFKPEQKDPANKALTR